MIKAILIIGKPGCGKSNMVWFLGGILEEEGYTVQYLSDRIWLEEGVLKDTAQAHMLPDGTKLGIHSKLIADGPPGHRKVHVLDGTILNRAHKKMITHIARVPKSNKVIIAEYAIGPDIDFGSHKEPLFQAAHHLVELLKEFQVLKDVIIFDVEAPLAVREVREGKRRDAMAVETFRAYFPDGGEIEEEDREALGSRYVQYKNNIEDHEGYYSEIHHLYDRFIRPNLQTPDKFSFVRNVKHHRMRKVS